MSTTYEILRRKGRSQILITEAGGKFDLQITDPVAAVDKTWWIVTEARTGDITPGDAVSAALALLRVAAYAFEDAEAFQDAVRAALEAETSSEVHADTRTTIIAAYEVLPGI